MKILLLSLFLVGCNSKLKKEIETEKKYSNCLIQAIIENEERSALISASINCITTHVKTSLDNLGY